MAPVIDMIVEPRTEAMQNTPKAAVIWIDTSYEVRFRIKAKKGSMKVSRMKPKRSERNASIARLFM